MSFWIEVGKPKYAADKVQITKKIDDGVLHSERIGEILLGSLVEVHFAGMPTLMTIDQSTKVIGGQTVIGYAFSVKDGDKASRLSHIIKGINRSDVGNIPQSDIKQLIILTTPHETCVNIPNQHNCDTHAKKLAEQLAGSLQNDSRKIVTVHGNIDRNYIDLNRSFSRYFTHFRSAIRNRIKTQIDRLSAHNNSTINNIIYLIDCHSFPNSESFNTVRTKHPEIALLSGDPKDFVLVHELYDLLNENDIKVTIFPGIMDDIIDEAGDIDNSVNDIKIVPVLVEVNEAISDERIMKISGVFNDWITTVNEFLMGKS